jgi:hypothetical protein
MSAILRRGDKDSDDEYTDTEETPINHTEAPEINYTEAPIIAPKPTRPKGPPKTPKSHVCQKCGESFARNTCLTRHIKELRCPILRNESLNKEAELTARERRIQEMENQIADKLIKSQEKIKKPRKPRVAKPKTVTAVKAPVETAPPAPPRAPATKPQPRKPIVNF